MMFSAAVNCLPCLSTCCEPFNVSPDSITSHSNVSPESKKIAISPLEHHTIIIRY